MQVAWSRSKTGNSLGAAFSYWGAKEIDGWSGRFRWKKVSILLFLFFLFFFVFFWGRRRPFLKLDFRLRAILRGGGEGKSCKFFCDREGGEGFENCNVERALYFWVSRNQGIFTDLSIA